MLYASFTTYQNWDISEEQIGNTNRKLDNLLRDCPGIIHAKEERISKIEQDFLPGVSTYTSVQEPTLVTVLEKVEKRYGIDDVRVHTLQVHVLMEGENPVTERNKPPILPIEEKINILLHGRDYKTELHTHTHAPYSTK